MSDLRATERLLEVIEDHLTKIVIASRGSDDETIYDHACDSLDVLGKLRRRGPLIDSKKCPGVAITTPGVAAPTERGCNAQL